jgi:hypothetical protein
MTTTLLTGLPRSGTTLICALLNDCRNTVALAEPLRLEHHGNRQRAVAEIDDFVTATRRQLLQEKQAVSTHVAGKIPDNWVSEPTALGQFRSIQTELGAIPFTKPLTPDFHLFIKHPGEFSALSDLLAPRYPMIAVVRNPLAVLASWQTVPLAVSTGRLPVAEAFNPDLAARLKKIDDRLDRQVALLEWLLELYATFRPEQILRYEDLLQSPLDALAKLKVQADVPLRRLAPHDILQRYPSVNLHVLSIALLKIAPSCEKFYPGITEKLEDIA